MPTSCVLNHVVTAWLLRVTMSPHFVLQCQTFWVGMHGGLCASRFVYQRDDIFYHHGAGDTVRVRWCCCVFPATLGGKVDQDVSKLQSMVICTTCMCLQFQNMYLYTMLSL